MEMIAVDQLKEGGILAEDVYDSTDAMLLAADTVLNARHLALLKSRGVESVAIRPEEVFCPKASAVAAAADSVTTRIVHKDSTGAVSKPKAATAAPPVLDAAAQKRVDRLKAMFVAHIRNPWMHALFVAAVRRAAEGRRHA